MHAALENVSGRADVWESRLSANCTSSNDSSKCQLTTAQ